MNFLKFIVLVFICSVIGFVAGTWLRMSENKIVIPAKSYTPQKSSFKFEPPAQSLKGTISTVSGFVEKLSREENWAQVRLLANDNVLQGETITASDEAKVSIEFPSAKKVTLQPETTIGLIQTLPQSFLIRQGDGKVTYEVGAGDKPLSVRIQHVLFTLNSGKATVTFESPRVTIQMLEGKGKFAVIDLDNNTKAWSLGKDQQAVVNDNTRLVRIEEME